MATLGRKGGWEMSEVELKNCPFCSGEAVLCHCSTGSGYIACIGDCEMATRTFWDERIDNTGTRKWYEVAAENWNRRANGE